MKEKTLNQTAIDVIESIVKYSNESKEIYEDGSPFDKDEEYLKITKECFRNIKRILDDNEINEDQILLLLFYSLIKGVAHSVYELIESYYPFPLNTEAKRKLMSRDTLVVINEKLSYWEDDLIKILNESDEIIFRPDAMISLNLNPNVKIISLKIKKK